MSEAYIFNEQSNGNFTVQDKDFSSKNWTDMGTMVTIHSNFTTCDNATGETLNYYSWDYRIVGTVFQGLVFLVGVLGNIMVVLVVKRTRSMHNPTNCYLVSLAIADCLVLMAAIPNEIISYYILGDQWLWGRAGCAIFIFSQHLGIQASSLSITAFTVERYIAICHPMFAQKVCTVKRAKKIILAVWTFVLIYCSPWLALTTTVPLQGHPGLERCTFAMSRENYLGFYFADLIMFYVVPLILSIILYGLIARILFSNTIPKTPGNPNGSAGGDSKKSNSGSTARIQVVKMLIVVVVMFAVLWMPYRALLVYNSLSKVKFLDLWYLMFSKTMVFINSAINPILYNAMSVKFRRAFKRMLSCGSPDRSVYYSEVTTETTISNKHRSMATKHISCEEAGVTSGV